MKYKESGYCIMAKIAQKFALITTGAVTLLTAISSSSNAVTIDFETGFSDLDPVSAVATSDGNQVTFSVGPGLAGGISSAFIAEVGDPFTAFIPSDGEGTALEPEIGRFFLADDNGAPLDAFNYFMEFSNPISNLSVDLLDFRIDGGGSSSDTVTLTVFSDSFTTAIGSAVFDITDGLPIGALATLSVDNPSGLVRSASIVHSGSDLGTGIDNISFTTNSSQTSTPEPESTLGILALSMLAIKLLKSRK